MRPPGSNYKNYCSSKLLMSCDVLPTCEGLGVEKARSPDEDVRGEPHSLRPAPSPRQERSSVPRPQKQTRKKAKDMQPGRRGERISCSRRSMIKIRALFSQR